MPSFARRRLVPAVVSLLLAALLGLLVVPAMAHGAVETPHPAASVGSGQGYVTPPARAASVQATVRLRGPDLSAYNGWINWSAVRGAGNAFAFAKATEGLTYNDAPFVANWRGIAAQRFDLRGAYHFARPQPGRSPIEEAHHFTNQVVKAGGWRAGDVPVLDLEWVSGMSAGDLRAWAKNWLIEVWKTTGRKPIIYTGAWFWNDKVGCTSLGGFKVWTASYTASPIVPCGFSTWTFWQYTDHGSFAPGQVGDMSIFNGSLAQLRALGGITTTLRPVLRGGARGPAVYELTKSLSYLGYLPYPVIGRPRSVFGGWVNTAVAHFKRDYHLTPTPIVDQPVWTALDRAVKSRGANGYKPKVTPPLPSPVAQVRTLPQRAKAASLAPITVKAARPVAHCVYRTTLRQGNGGRDVAVLHVRLTELAFWPKTSGAHISRYFGAGTTTAVKRFQGIRHLRADGVVGLTTLRALGMSLCAPSNAQLRVTIALDGTPTYRGLALMLQDGRGHGWTGSLTSSDRRPGVAERFGRSSQTALWLCWIHRVSGCNPANPPGRSTHEQRSDGIAYAGPPGRLLAWWQMGMDVSNSTQALAVLHRLGYCVRRPYTSGSEAHHLNLCADPTPVLRRHKLAA